MFSAKNICNSAKCVPIDQNVSLSRLNLKGNNNTTRTNVPVSWSTTYALLRRVDSNNG